MSADKMVYGLLAINDASSRQIRFLSRSGGDDTYVLNVDGDGADARGKLKLGLTTLLKAGKIFQRAVFTTHGNEGVIFFGNNRINAKEWYAGFSHSGFERLFPFTNAKIYFAGCNVAEGESGWQFLEAAAKTFLRYAGGTAIGWTSLGFGTPWGHVEHLWGNTRRVKITPGRADLEFSEPLEWTGGAVTLGRDGSVKAVR